MKFLCTRCKRFQFQNLNGIKFQDISYTSMLLKSSMEVTRSKITLRNFVPRREYRAWRRPFAFPHVLGVCIAERIQENKNEREQWVRSMEKCLEALWENGCTTIRSLALFLLRPMGGVPMKESTALRFERKLPLSVVYGNFELRS